MNEQTMPRISVVLPVYNALPYLEEAVASVLGQSFADFELIAIDDGSTDDSLAVLQRLADGDARLRIITRENRGITPTLNEGIAAATGEFIARMDGDDICLPDRFARQVAFLDRHPEVVVVGGRFLVIDPEGRPLVTMAMPPDHTEIDARHMGGRTMALCHPAAMIRRDAALAVGGYCEEYVNAQDIDFWLRLAEVGRLANLDEVLLKYRQHPKSVGYARRAQQVMSAWQAAQRAAERRGIAFDVPPPETAPATAELPYRKWGWWALTEGHVATARHYAFKTLRTTPFDRESWRLAYSTLRGS